MQHRWNVSSNTAHILERQKPNPIVSSIKSIRVFYYPHLYGADFICSKDICGLFLSLQYHAAYSQYIFQRVNNLPQCKHRFLILLLDTTTEHLPVITELSLIGKLTLLVAHNYREAAKWVEAITVISSDNTANSSDTLTLCQDDPAEFLLSCVPRLSRKNVVSLFEKFGNLKGIAKASVSDIAGLSGFGDKKARKIHALFNQRFIKGRKRTISDFLKPSNEGVIEID
ncbi:hypothetical protein P9112_009296 [Eukaryota sp. TZLM1-RC]